MSNLKIQMKFNKTFSLLFIIILFSSTVYSISSIFLEAQKIFLTFLSLVWILFLSVYNSTFTGIPIDRKGLARGSIYLLLFSFFILYVTYFHQFVHFVFAATATSIDMWLNDTLNDNISLTYPSASNATAALSVSGTSTSFLKLQSNGSIVANDIVLSSTVAETGTATLTCTSGTIVSYSSQYGRNCAGTCPVNCGSCTIGSTSCSITYNNANCGDCNSGCAKNGDLSITCGVNATEVTNLGVGVYNYTAFYTGDTYNDPSSRTQWLTISSGSTTIYLAFNGTQTNKSFDPGSAVNVTAWNNVGQGNISIIRNGTTVAASDSSSSVSYITTYPTITDYNFTITLSSPNYTASSITKFLTIYPSINITCSAGGPYLAGSTVVITGNVTNYTGSFRSANVNITINTTGVTKTTMSDSNGTYYLTHTGLGAGGYSATNVANSTGTITATCIANFTVQAFTTTANCRMKTIQFNGTVIDSGSGNVIRGGNVTSTIVDTNSTGTAVVGSNGKFSVSINGCLKYGTRYLVTNIVDDISGKRGWFDFIYIPT